MPACPPACCNLVFGVPSEVSEHLLAKDAVRKISFTGSIPVGKHLAQLAAKGMKRTTMELGGHSPVVVFGDADPEKAADTIAAFKYRNAGQVCISPTRFYVQEDVYKKFLARFTEYAKGIKVGDGLEKGIAMGPLANSRRLDAMDCVRRRRQGPRRQDPDRRHAARQPGLLLRADRDHRRAGRLQDHDAGAVRPAGADRHLQDLRRGGRARQLAGVRSRGLRLHLVGATAAAIGDAIESGMVGINSIAVSTPETPFGGVKELGHGSEGGTEGLARLSRHQVHLAGLNHSAKENRHGQS